MNESAITFECHGDRLIGIVHETAHRGDQAAVFVVGGPQYRVGSHRMFVELARALADAGLPALRFDCRGMGDSDGTFASFEEIGPDIRAAIDAAMGSMNARGVVLVGLCDGASACAMYAAEGDLRVAAMVLINPWVHSTGGEAKARVEHYYRGRASQWEFWRRLLSGEVNVVRSAISFLRDLRLSAERTPENTFVDRMLRGVEAFDEKIFVLLSAADLTAQEFGTLVRDSARWARALARPNVTSTTVTGADHTFSGDDQSEAMIRHIVDFAASLAGTVPTKSRPRSAPQSGAVG